MDLSGIKLVVTDMDGTLLNSKHEVSPLFYELYKEIRERGILFAAASGRQYDSIAEKLQPIKDDIIIIAENGGFATYEGKEIVSTPLGPEQQEEALEVLQGVEDIYTVLCGKDCAVIRDDSGEFETTLQEYYTSYRKVSDLRDYKGEIMKIAVYHYESSERFIYPAAKQLEGKLKVKVSGENWVDLSHPDAHKGFALEKIQQKLGISAAETIVFGDYNNDLEMLALADFSFAMANAHDNVLNAARYKTLSNDENGVEHILRKLLQGPV